MARLSLPSRCGENDPDCNRLLQAALVNVAAVVPAHNEAPRMGPVLQALLAARSVHEVILVDDASTDGTGNVARATTAIRTIALSRNVGKGGALKVGVLATQADVVLFLDADLVGLTPAHIDALLLPVLREDAQMTVGLFQGGRYVTDLSQLLVPYISGQRALRRELFLAVPGLDRARFAVETMLTRYAKAARLRVKHVPLHGVTHIMKEEKRGLVRGLWDRLRMYHDISSSLLRNGYSPLPWTPRRPGTGS